MIPLPNKGSFGHKDIENKVEAGDGLKWENEFKKVITLILNGKMPERWKDHISALDQDVFKDYISLTADIRELINLFLGYNI